MSLSDVLVRMAFTKDRIATLYELGLEYEQAFEVRSSLFILFIKRGLMKRMRGDSSNRSLRYIHHAAVSLNGSQVSIHALSHILAQRRDLEENCLCTSSCNVRKCGFKLS